MAPLQNATSFLIQMVFDLYLMVLLFRLLFQYLEIDYYNPFSQFVIKATRPVVTPLRRFIPGLWGIDFATVAAIVGLTLLKILLISVLGFFRFPGLMGWLVWTIGSICALIINLFFYAVLMSVILSWISPRTYSPMTNILYRLTDPLMRPVRRFIPLVAGFDITPIPVLIGLQLLSILIADPLVENGKQLALLR